MALAKSIGCETAASTLEGTVRSAGQLFELSRMRIGGGLPLTYFANVVGGPQPTAADFNGISPQPPTPTPTAAPAPTPSATPTPTPSPTPTSTPTPTPTPAPTPPPTPTPRPTPAVSASTP